MTVKEIAKQNPNCTLSIMASCGMVKLPAKRLLTDAQVTMYPGAPEYGMTEDAEYILSLEIAQMARKEDVICLLTN